MAADNIRFDQVWDFNRWAGVEAQHPFVSSFTHPDGKKCRPYRQYYNIFALVLMKGWAGDILYGGTKYDYDAGTLIFASPGQVTDFRYMKEDYVPKGRVLLWHPDFIAGTSLATKMHLFSYFGYNVREALRPNERELTIISQLLDNIEEIVEQPRTENGDRLLLANIELMLTYCLHFYERQFNAHKLENNALLSKLEALVNGYLSSDRPKTEGLLSVNFCAEELNLSSNYFSDLVRIATGQPALKYIHEKLIEFAKYRLADSDKNINEVAYSLGFDYPQHFTRFFKKMVGCSPSEYRQSIR
ncbi:MAG: AraC family transcriptional regulator [Prevotellaceae bacterium]|nr:AraC family transcriptional regulator [Prevotellaceae bacterium]